MQSLKAEFERDAIQAFVTAVNSGGRPSSLGGRPRCMNVEMTEKAKRMHEEGFSYRRIGLVIGVSHNTVRRYLSDYKMH